ncbi:phage tail assembly protein [Acinetobacter pollinis]|uniref:phage tail assembly protein n=1 Tax=Acinetobacter pollinis TaxID=2605270 RepID=UPI0018A2BFC1|nr:phage tail assembly protein [Acinetobacter pollinis]MBF7690867.1 phage tail assembly protein [Acinetobacter pollinis]MBF7698512.1 phage tail assembly protein [Acinetobacter pollinis]
MTTEQQQENLEAINLDLQTIELDSDIQIAGQRLEKLDIRKPNIQALSGVKISDLLQADVNAILKVLPRVSNPTLTTQQVNQLEPSDIAQVGGVLMIFLQPKSQRAELLRQQ